MNQQFTTFRRVLVAMALLATVFASESYAQGGTQSEAEGCKQCQWLFGTCTYCPSGYSSGWWSCFGTCTGWCSVSNTCSYALEATDINAEGGLAGSTISPQRAIFMASALLPSLLVEQYERNCKGIIVSRYYTRDQGVSLRESSRAMKI